MRRSRTLPLTCARISATKPGESVNRRSPGSDERSRSMTGSIQIGVIGAARIVPLSLTKPAAKISEVQIAAIAARDPGRARLFAAKHGIAHVHDSYEALIADKDIDAVYIALPNSLHGK